MKRILLAASLMMCIVSCSKESVVKNISDEPISFSNVFVDNSTKAAIDDSYNSNSLTEFEVYGTITNSLNQSGNIFNQERVWKTQEGGWTYDPNNIQYWIPGNKYNFTAIAEGNVAKVTEVLANNETKVPTAIELYDASQQKDILYAKSGEIEYKSGDKAETVDFTFSHLMSKAKFTVKNTITANSGYSYKVKGIQITNAAKSSTYTIGSGWNGSKGTYSLNFGDVEGYESKYERLLIPTDNVQDKKTDINISFTCELYKDNILLQTTTNAYTAQVKLEAGHAYNFVIELGNPGDPIKFTVYSVGEWSTPVTVVTTGNNN